MITEGTSIIVSDKIIIIKAECQLHPSNRWNQETVASILLVVQDLCCSPESAAGLAEGFQFLLQEDDLWL